MTIKALLYLIQILKETQKNLRTDELLKGLTLVYELEEEEHIKIQKEIYQLTHPALDGFTDNDSVEVELLDVKFIFVKK